MLFNSLPNNKILDRSKFKAFLDDKINVTQKFEFVLEMLENIDDYSNEFPLVKWHWMKFSQQK